MCGDIFFSFKILSFLCCQIHIILIFLVSSISLCSERCPHTEIRGGGEQSEYRKTSRWDIKVVWAKDYCGLDWDDGRGHKKKWTDQYIIWRLTCWQTDGGKVVEKREKSMMVASATGGMGVSFSHSWAEERQVFIILPSDIHRHVIPFCRVLKYWPKYPWSGCVGLF